MIYPEDAPCKKCICQNGFNGKHKFWLEIKKSTFPMQTSSPIDLMLLYLIWIMYICNALIKCNLANGLTSRTWAQIFLWPYHTIVNKHTAGNCYIHTYTLPTTHYYYYYCCCCWTRNNNNNNSNNNNNDYDNNNNSDENNNNPSCFGERQILS